ncbi:MAG: hypothetical protein COB36_13690 [Alphaproteobacteria bacterium]|nr:MAG: hypothetical protein COB36_13690 [Alphaproteobacteria bacterium]
MRLRHIEVFHAVYLTGSASGAARALNVSQPSISKVLKHAEDQLGFQLFDRAKGRLIPTQKGTKLFDEIEPVFEKINDLKAFAAKLAITKKGRLRFAMTPAFSLEIAPKAIAEFSKLHPDVIIEVETLHASEVIKALQEEAIDIGLVFDAPYVPTIESTIIGKTDFVCVAHTHLKLPRGDEIRLQDLKDFPLITLNEKSILGRLLSAQLSDAFSGPVDSRIIVETYHVAKRLVQQNAGIAIVDKITAFSGDTSNLQFKNLANKIEISIGLVSRLNEPLSGFRQDFIHILSQKMDQYLNDPKLMIL